MKGIVVVTDLRTGMRVTMFNSTPETTKGVAQYMHEHDQKLGRDIFERMHWAWLAGYAKRLGGTLAYQHLSRFMEGT